MRVTRGTHSELNGDLIDTVTVEPHQTARLVVGIYETATPHPGVCLQYEPDVRDDISAASLKIPGDGEYTLVYQLENYGDVACTVSVWECKEAAEESAQGQ